VQLNYGLTPAIRRQGNSILYDYAAENDKNIDASKVSERNRVRTANRYLRSVKYGNPGGGRGVTTGKISLARLKNHSSITENSGCPVHVVTSSTRNTGRFQTA
jgi:hypothetical protein